MYKPAVTDVELHDLIRNRWSPRAFAEKVVAPDVLRSLFEAARWAPSSNNEQPWVYLVATKDDPENFAKMLGVLVEFNASWAKRGPVMALPVAHLKTEREGKPNRVALHDVGSATADNASTGACFAQLALNSTNTPSILAKFSGSSFV